MIETKGWILLYKLHVIHKLTISIFINNLYRFLCTIASEIKAWVWFVRFLERIVGVIELKASWHGWNTVRATWLYACPFQFRSQAIWQFSTWILKLTCAFLFSYERSANRHQMQLPGLSSGARWFPWQEHGSNNHHVHALDKKSQTTPRASRDVP